MDVRIMRSAGRNMLLLPREPDNIWLLTVDDQFTIQTSTWPEAGGVGNVPRLLAA